MSSTIAPVLFLKISIAKPPASKSAAKSSACDFDRSRIKDEFLRKGIDFPFRGKVRLSIDIEEGPSRDLDNRIRGVFTLLDSRANANGALLDDGQIISVRASQRRWGRGEDFFSVTAKLIKRNRK